ncbi:MAG: hypothetical protein LBV42_05220 [Methanobrevibacter sp.]|jgi:hypothetical protein|nr:hypothetical protein [Methanobrevibacter sp.]
MSVREFQVQHEKTIKHSRMDSVFEDFRNNYVVIVEIRYTEDQTIKVFTFYIF